MENAGLILEGGGMKGVYTAGVLDFFIEKDIVFSSCYGVSAGACAMMSYLSKQKGRAYHTMTDYLGDKNYMGWYSLLTTGDLFNVNTGYKLIPEYLNPFDNDTFHEYKGKAYAVVTNIVTGKPEYLRIRDGKEDITAIRASASLPLVSRKVYINDTPYLDGGISDPVPVRRSVLDGNVKNVVILTKDKGFFRKPTKHTAIFNIRYPKYQKIASLMKNRHIVYNDTMHYMKEKEKEDRVFVIRPSKSLEISRTEKDAEKLREMYELGYEDAKAAYVDMMEFLQKEV